MALSLVGRPEIGLGEVVWQITDDACRVRRDLTARSNVRGSSCMIAGGHSTIELLTYGL